MKWLIFLLPIVFIQSSVGNDLTEREYQIRLQKINERYSNFHERAKDLKRLRARRQNAASEFTEDRKAKGQRREKARKQFIKVRKKTSNREKLKLAYEKRIKKKVAFKENQRKKYVARKSRLAKILQSARRIPDDQVVGLKPVLKSPKSKKKSSGVDSQKE